MTHIAALRHAAEAEGVSLRVQRQHGDPAGVIVLHANARALTLSSSVFISELVWAACERDRLQNESSSVSRALS